MVTTKERQSALFDHVIRAIECSDKSNTHGVQSLEKRSAPLELMFVEFDKPISLLFRFGEEKCSAKFNHI